MYNSVAMERNENWKFCFLSEEEYRSYWASHPQRTFLNSPETAVLKQMQNWENLYPAVRDGDGNVICAALLTSTKIMKIYRYYDAMRGPLTDYRNAEVLRFFFAELKKYMHAHKGLYLECTPNVLYKQLDSDGNIVEGGFDHSYVIENMEKAGLTHMPFTHDMTHDITWMFTMDLRGKDEQTVLKEMDQQTRWSVHRTEKNGIKVRELHGEELQIFIDMEKETGRRRGFAARTDEFYYEQAKAFGDHEKVIAAYLDTDDYIARLNTEKESLLKEKQELEQSLQEQPSKKHQKRLKVVDEAAEINERNLMNAQELRKQYGSVIYMAASLFIIYDNEIIYLNSATHDVFRKFYAPYAIQWYIIRYALAHNIPRYNFYGISGDFSEDAADYGVYMFKKGFNGTVEQLVGEFILPVHEGAYAMYKKLKG